MNNMQRGFFKTTTQVFRMGLSAQSIAVYCFLASGNEEFNPSVRYIAVRCKLSKNTVIKSLKELMAKNIIKQIAPGSRGNVTRYEFVNPKGWKSNGADGKEIFD